MRRFASPSRTRQQNKNRNLDQLVEHLTEDKLVMWAWSPGEGQLPYRCRTMSSPRR